MKGRDSIKTVVVGDSPTDPLRDEVSQLKYYSRTRFLEEVLLNRHYEYSSTDISSIAITNCNLHPISKLQSAIEDSTLPLPTLTLKNQRSLTDDSLWFPFQRSSVDPSLINRGLQLPSMNWVCSYFEGFSQSTTCNAIRFGECSLTLLDRLWYLYSYIYKPLTTICYGIYIFLNSRHTGPIRLLPSVKPTTTPSASLPLFTTRSFTTSSSTTRSTLQLSILLESTSAPSLSITLGPFFVNFITSITFQSLAAVDN